jgi:hypothetical protein
MAITAVASNRPPGTSWPALAWALTLTLVTTVLLGALAHVVFLMDALAYGFAEVISTESDLAAPDLARYVTAFGVSSVLAVGGGLLLTVALGRTEATRWPSAARGMTAAFAASLAAASSMFAMLEINPLALLP